MKAAVIRSFDRAAVYGEFDDPLPAPGGIILTVSAAALTPLANSQASGQHYSSGDTHSTAFDSVRRGSRIRFACRRFGNPSGVPLVLNQRFTGTMDHCDPAVTDAHATLFLDA
jgi:hypothetical protein